MKYSVYKTLPLSIVLSFGLSGCVSLPTALTTEELVEVNKADKVLVTEEVEAVGTTLSLPEAMARALKYNLEHRISIVEQSLAAAKLEAADWDVLPKLMAGAQHSWRDSKNVRDSALLSSPNTINSSTSYSAEPSHTSANLTLAWNSLEYGQAYYVAQQNGNEVYLASENRRKAMHSLLQDVRTTYWRAVAAESIQDRIAATIAQAEQALADSQELTKTQTGSMEQALKFQRNLLENLRLLEKVQNELANARHELTYLVGLPAGTQFKLQKPFAAVEVLKIDAEQHEAFALVNNPVLRNKHLDARNAVIETRKAMLKIMPELNFEYGFNYDNDMFLQNNSWQAASMRVNYNLMQLVSHGADEQSAENNQALAELQRLAMQMSVLTQVHLARQEYVNTRSQYFRAMQIFNVDSKLEGLMRAKFENDLVGEQSMISASVTAILSELRGYQTMSRLQAAAASLQATIGMDVIIGSVSDMELRTLAGTMNKVLIAGVNDLPIAQQ